MRLPYVQITMEVIELSAPELAVLLDAEEPLVGWGLVRLVRWALARCPDDRPPSASDTVRGPLAPRLIAQAAGWPGDPELFVEACASLPYPILERVAEGVRVRGLDRYDPAWGKNHPELWKEWKAGRHAPVPSSPPPAAEPAPTPARNRAESGPKREHQTQTQTQIQTHPKEEEALPPAAPARAPAPVGTLPGLQDDLVPPPKLVRLRTKAQLRERYREPGRQVFQHWQRIMGKPRSQFGEDKQDAVAGRLHGTDGTDGYSVEDLCHAVEGCALSAFHMGRDPKHPGKVNNDLELICRDSKRVDQFMGIREEALAAGASPPGAPPAPPAPPPEAGSPAGVWAAALARMREEGKSYAADLLEKRVRTGEAFVDGQLLLFAPDPFAQRFVVDHYAGLLSELLPGGWELQVAAGGAS